MANEKHEQIAQILQTKEGRQKLGEVLGNLIREKMEERRRRPLLVRVMEPLLQKEEVE